ncbi:hypothetical protein CLOP_g348 [Closterium sp. NIES-67]|nr:hypothetical protein CLOP_g348 [Closterium sp. NIES-67]
MGRSKEPPILPFTSSTVSRDASSSINVPSALPTSSSSSSLSSNPNIAIALLLLSRLRDAVRAAAAQQRPWLELVDRSAFARPESLSDAASRIRKNSRYFHANYLVVLFLAIIVSVLHNPFAILWLAILSAAWGYTFLFRPGPITIAGRSFSEREKLVIMCLLSALVVFGLSPLGSAVMSGTVIGVAVICCHAAFRVPDDLFLDDSVDGLAGLGMGAGSSSGWFNLLLGSSTGGVGGVGGVGAVGGVGGVGMGVGVGGVGGVGVGRGGVGLGGSGLGRGNSSGVSKGSNSSVSSMDIPRRHSASTLESAV